ncbi:MAG: hypothetical protein ACRD8U_12405 [Pyrinomonadaceae bacterium]
MKTFFFVFIFAAIANATYAQEPQPTNSSTPPEPPQVEILSQPDSPLRIVSVKTKWARPDHSGIELFVVVENSGVKIVSAYATRNDVGLNDCMALSAKSPGKALRPGQTEGRSTWRVYNPSSPLRRLVDFVEFTDGTTWGTDVCQTAEWLVSVRAGAREARKLLLQTFAAGGADAVIKILKSELTVEPPPNHSQKWKENFRLGFNGYLDRNRQADQEWGYTEIEYALKRPISAVNEKEP